MKIFRFFILSAMMIIVSNFADIAQADNYSNTVEVFKKSKAVQPFLKTPMAMPFSRPLEKVASVLGGPTVKGKYIGEVK